MDNNLITSHFIIYIPYYGHIIFMQRNCRIMLANPVGFHTKLTPQVKEHILSHVAGNYTGGQIARMARIPKNTLNNWLKRGREDAENEINSIFAQLWVEVEEKRGIEIKSIL